MEISLFKTSDLNLASTLATLGFTIETTDNSNPKRVYFFFKPSPELEEAVKSYWQGELKVDAKQIGICRREILRMIHEQTGAEKSYQKKADNDFQRS